MMGNQNRFASDLGYVTEGAATLDAINTRQDRETLLVGEQITIDQPALLRAPDNVFEPLTNERWKVVNESGETVKVLPDGFDSNATWRHDSPGTYRIIRPSGEQIMRYEIEPKNGRTVDESPQLDRDDFRNVNGGDGINPSNYRGIVNADNDKGIALAPALRREGASLGPDGATVTLPDGETVDVGAIEESDEVARYLDGDRAGDVVEADRPAVDGGSSSGGSGGMIGGAVAVVVLLVAGAAALLGGGD